MCSCSWVEEVWGEREQVHLRVCIFSKYLRTHEQMTFSTYSCASASWTLRSFLCLSLHSVTAHSFQMMWNKDVALQRFFCQQDKAVQGSWSRARKKKKVPFCRADVPDVEPILKSAHPFLKASPCTKSHTWSWLLIFLFLATNPVPPGGKAWQRVKRLWWLIFAAASNQNRKLCCTFPDHALQNCVFSK